MDKEPLDDRDNRFRYGKFAEKLTFEKILNSGGWARKIGQEIRIPKWVHKIIRDIHDNPSINMLRHFPDIDASINEMDFLVTVKSGPNASQYPTLTIEQASLEIAKELHSLGIPVLVYWVTDEGFYKGWADKIEPELPSMERNELHGSQTPMYIVRKNKLTYEKQRIDFNEA